MNNLEDIIKEFNFSEEFGLLIKKSETYEDYASIPETITVEIEQQGVVSTNNITYSSY